MRTVFCFWLILIAAPVQAGGDVNDCMARCSAKIQPCLQGCKDDKCMMRCSSQIQTCASTCEGKGVDPKLLQTAKKEQDAQSSQQQPKTPGRKR